MKRGNVIEMRLPLREAETMYLTGTTLILLAGDRVLFDKDGTPVLKEEFYKITSQGIARVA